MNKIKSIVKKGLVRYGSAIAAFAFTFVAVAANSSCYIPYYEPKEPNGLEKFKKFNR